MVRLYLFAEGQTEQTFANMVLKPHLANFRVYMQNPVLIAHARKRGIVHRGGGRNFIAMQNDIKRLLKQESTRRVFFTTMIDLYGIHAGFPGVEGAETLRSDPYKRVEFLEKSWGARVSDSRFIPYIQLHEFEAYLFSDVSQFGFFFENASNRIVALKKILDDAQSPERIDDGQHTAPSKRIIQQFPDYKDMKPIVGPQMAKRIGVENIRYMCSHFGNWLEQLENLGAKLPKNR